jgi:hypothetical protein
LGIFGDRQASLLATTITQVSAELRDGVDNRFVLGKTMRSEELLCLFAAVAWKERGGGSPRIYAGELGFQAERLEWR